MLRIAVCDDSPLQSQALCDLIRLTLCDKLYLLTAYETAAALLRQAREAPPDIVFLDIELGPDNGIAAAKALNAFSPHTQVIFVTAYSAYAGDIYEAEHSYFLLKPVQPEKLSAALDKAVLRLSLLRQSRILLPLSGGVTRVFALDELLYFERVYRTTIIHTNAAAFQMGMKLNDLEPLLPAGVFARPHNSFLVHLGHVRSADRLAVRLDNDVKLPISNQKRSAFHQALAAYI